jgi:hypothetical protein
LDDLERDIGDVLSASLRDGGGRAVSPNSAVPADVLAAPLTTACFDPAGDASALRDRLGSRPSTKLATTWSPSCGAAGQALPPGLF